MQYLLYVVNGGAKEFYFGGLNKDKNQALLYKKGITYKTFSPSGNN